MIRNIFSRTSFPSFLFFLGVVTGVVAGVVTGVVAGVVTAPKSSPFLLMEVPIFGLQKVTSEYITSVTISTFSPVSRSQE